MLSLLFFKPISVSEKGNYAEAKKILERLMKEAPHVSEYHRVPGQVYSEEDDQDKAIASVGGVMANSTAANCNPLNTMPVPGARCGLVGAA